MYHGILCERLRSYCQREIQPEAIGLLGLSEIEEPYELWKSDKFVADLTLWPPVEYGHISCYFVERPGIFTRRELMQWKSMEAYNYFQSGRVRCVKVFQPQSQSSVILMALMNPSQSSPNNAHQAWVGLRGDGEIVTAHCTCMTG